MPVGKQVGSRAARLGDQIRNPLAALEQALQQFVEGGLVTLQPLRRDLAAGLVDDLLVEVDHLVQPWLEIIP